ncbi:MAG TPA: TMEM175 family protein [Candidatus Bathyarchaeia archaeon]|nr:TMEM175 family protein [Candidatus Bathyarchaeia archaeon]
MRDRWSTGRLEAFSDGVFAIAITLLVLELSVPERGFEDLWKGIADQWPSYLAYITSFVTIGGMWMAHHGIFRRLASADGMVMRLNILLLMLVSFLPFPTKLMAEAIDKTTHAERAAVIFYGLVLLAISLVTGALWRYVAAHRDLIEPEVSDDEIRTITALTTPNIGFYVAVVLLAFIAPQVAAFGYLLIAVIALFRQHGDAMPART